LERADRHFGALLQELRVTRTGVQILFAFLLPLAFTQRFPSLDAFQRGAKARIVQVSSRLATVGMGSLVLAFTGSVLLVVDVTTGRAGGAAAGTATLLVYLGLWGLLPRFVRRAGHAEGRETAQSHPAPRPAQREVIRAARGDPRSAR
jgi:hypothetical protein